MSLCLDDSGKCLCSCLPFQRSFIVVVWGREVIEMINFLKTEEVGSLDLLSVIWLILCGCHGMTKQNWSLLGDFCGMTGSTWLFVEIRRNYTLQWTVTIICLWYQFSHILRGLCLKLGLFWPAYPFSTSISSNRFGYTAESLACALRLREPGAVELPLSSPSAATPRGAELARHDFS